ncbi:unnamed protein product [Thlaspi arvense]|uniref:Uncharacterized protein n=1 Tax=Thlaspi arvense TaxID=13288 RepID=A0AAU9SEE4_THLAR|nr:unnamed protein product [Thlaspi arvense]
MYVVVNTVVGDPEEYNNLVPPSNRIDKDFEAVVLRRADWISSMVDFVTAFEDIGTQHAKNAEPRITTEPPPLIDSEKFHKILNMVVILTSKVKIIQQVFWIPEENEADGKGSEENENVVGDGMQEDICNDTKSEDSRREANSNGSYAANDDNTQNHGAVEETADFVGEVNGKDASSVGIGDEETEVMVEKTQDHGDEEATTVVEGFIAYYTKIQSSFPRQFTKQHK